MRKRTLRVDDTVSSIARASAVSSGGGESLVPATAELRDRRGGTWLVRTGAVSFRALLVEAHGATPGVREALAEVGCAETWCVPSCEDAAALIRRDRVTPDLVLVELRAPDQRAIAPLRRLRNLPIIAIVDEAPIDVPLHEQIVDAVARPIRRIELMTRIRALLRQRSERARWAARERALGDEIERLQQANHELERLSVVDSLTGIANRSHVLSLLHAEWKRAARAARGEELALIMVDLDYFHAFNESYGHPGGDECLRRAARALVGGLRRPSDFLGRYGGEEFIAILAATDAAGARIVAERLRATVEALAIPHEASACARVVTLSAGFAAMRPIATGSVDDLVEAADSALRRAKQLGRNRIAGDAAIARGSAPLPRPALAGAASVVVDPWFAERVPSFLDTVRVDLIAAQDAARAGDFDRVRAIARRIKAASRELDFDELKRLASELERAGRGPDREAVRRAAEALAQYLAGVQVVYRRRTSEIGAQ